MVGVHSSPGKNTVVGGVMSLEGPDPEIEAEVHPKKGLTLCKFIALE